MCATYPTYFILLVLVTLVILGKDSNYEAPGCVILLLHLFQIHTFSSTLYFQPPSISVCFEVLTAVIIKGGGSKFYQDIDANLQSYTAEIQDDSNLHLSLHR
jgi:hypothetical protein